VAKDGLDIRGFSVSVLRHCIRLITRSSSSPCQTSLIKDITQF